MEKNPSVLTKQQYKTFGPQPAAPEYGPGAAIRALVRYDDECGNGHNTFSVTGHVSIPRRREPVACGCLHEEIAKAFPALAPLIKWHLCSSDGPMHYISNTVFAAGNRDCWGRRAGDPSNYEYRIRFNDVPVTHRLKKRLYTWISDRFAAGFVNDKNRGFEIFPIAHKKQEFSPKYSLVGYSAEEWHECPFDDKTEAEEFCAALNSCEIEFDKIPVAWSAGKVRDLDAARDTAIWPEATDEELTAPGLEQRLADRLPALLADFRSAVESLGFTY